MFNKIERNYSDKNIIIENDLENESEKNTKKIDPFLLLSKMRKTDLKSLVIFSKEKKKENYLSLNYHIKSFIPLDSKLYWH